MSSDFTTEDIPMTVRAVTRRVLANDPTGQAELLECAAWWSRHAGGDNVVTGLIITHLSLEDSSPIHDEVIEDHRENAIYHLIPQHPELVPDDSR